jgi:hypothetical protein
MEKKNKFVKNVNLIFTLKVIAAFMLAKLTTDVDFINNLQMRGFFTKVCHEAFLYFDLI